MPSGTVFCLVCLAEADVLGLVQLVGGRRPQDGLSRRNNFEKPPAVGRFPGLGGEDTEGNPCLRNW